MKKTKKLKGAEAFGVKMKVYKRSLVDEEKLMESEKMKMANEVAASPEVIDFLKKRHPTSFGL